MARDKTVCQMFLLARLRAQSTQHCSIPLYSIYLLRVGVSYSVFQTFPLARDCLVMFYSVVDINQIFFRACERTVTPLCCVATSYVLCFSSRSRNTFAVCWLFCLDGAACLICFIFLKSSRIEPGAFIRKNFKWFRRSFQGSHSGAWTFLHRSRLLHLSMNHTKDNTPQLMHWLIIRLTCTWHGETMYWVVD